MLVHRPAPLLIVAAALLVGASIASAAIDDIRPSDLGLGPGQWHPANERDGGSSLITTARPDQDGGAGSLGHSLPAPSANSPKTDFQVFSVDTTLDATLGFPGAASGFGLLSDLDVLRFDWYRDAASSAPGHFAPALRVWLFDPDAGVNGTSHLAIWEGVYNDYSISGPGVPTDQWVREDILIDNFWRIPQFINGAFSGFGACGGLGAPVECFVFDRDLTEWSYGPNTKVFGIEVGLGSGWAGSYSGAADLITIGFDGAEPTTWNFEPDTPTLDLAATVAPATLDLASDANSATAALTLANTGTADATNAIIADQIPAGTVLTSIDAAGLTVECSIDAATFGPCPAALSSVVALRWTVGTLTPTDPAVVVGYTFELTPEPASPTTFADEPTVVSDETSTVDGSAFSLPVQPAPTTTTTIAPTTTPPTTAPATTLPPATVPVTTALPTSTTVPLSDGGVLPATGSSSRTLILTATLILAAGVIALRAPNGRRSPKRH